MLERVARFRPNRPPNPTNRSRRGHGLVGWVWETGHWEREDLRAPGLRDISGADYAGLRPEIRRGRSYEEFRRNARDHGVILGVPVTDRFDFRGVTR